MAKENSEIITEVENLIVENKLEEAIKKLLPIFKESHDEDMVNECLLIWSRLKNFLRKSNLGVVDFFHIEYPKIQLSVLNLKNVAKKMVESFDKHMVEGTKQNVKSESKIIFED